MSRAPRNDPFDAFLAEIFASLTQGAAPQRQAPPEKPPAAATVAATVAAPQGADALYAAIAANDEKSFLAALDAGANVNAGKGRALRIAAENKNYPFMQELVIRGADIRLAIGGLKERQEEIAPMLRQQQDAIARELNSAITGGRRGLELETLRRAIDQITQRRQPTAEAQEQARNAATIKLLEEYHEIFFREIAPLENLRLQRRILAGLREVKEALSEKTLDKKKLPAPKAFGPGK